MGFLHNNLQDINVYEFKTHPPAPEKRLTTLYLAFFLGNTTKLYLQCYNYFLGWIVINHSFLVEVY